VSGTIPVDMPGPKQLGAAWRKHLPEIVLAGVPTILILLEIWWFDPGDEVARTLAGLAAGVSLFWIRRSPFAAFLTNGVAVYALIGLGYPSQFYQWTNLVALFAVAAREETRKAIAALALGWVGVILYFVRFPDEGGLILAGAVMAIWTAGWFAGRAQFARVREAEVIRERDTSRAELGAQQARAQLEAERGRIARDLHDIIGHAVNVMVVHAGAGLVKSEPASEGHAAFETIAATGRAALSDLDRMLDVLQGVPERSPLPGLFQLDDLCQASEGPGLRIELVMEGDAKRVPSSLGVATYRIIQEALTNVIKHARASQVSVNVRIANDLTITVSDDGIGGDVEPGRGLRGIRERAALHGGVVEHGPGRPEGFEVRCQLPLLDVM
jgi:signal transduction histidine kinase